MLIWKTEMLIWKKKLSNGILIKSMKGLNNQTIIKKNHLHALMNCNAECIRYTILYYTVKYYLI